MASWIYSQMLYQLSYDRLTSSCLVSCGMHFSDGRRSGRCVAGLHVSKVVRNVTVSVLPDGVCELVP